MSDEKDRDLSSENSLTDEAQENEEQNKVTLYEEQSVSVAGQNSSHQSIAENSEHIPLENEIGIIIIEEIPVEECLIHKRGNCCSEDNDITGNIIYEFPDDSDEAINGSYHNVSSEIQSTRFELKEDENKISEDNIQQQSKIVGSTNLTKTSYKLNSRENDWNIIASNSGSKVDGFESKNISDNAGANQKRKTPDLKRKAQDKTSTDDDELDGNKIFRAAKILKDSSNELKCSSLEMLISDKESSDEYIPVDINSEDFFADAEDSSSDNPESNSDREFNLGSSTSKSTCDGYPPLFNKVINNLNVSNTQDRSLDNSKKTSTFPVLTATVPPEENVDEVEIPNQDEDLSSGRYPEANDIIPDPSLQTSSSSVGNDDESQNEQSTATPNSLKIRSDVSRKKKCLVCRKRLSLVPIRCRCGGLYCATHRYDREHNCTFDYRAMGAEEIRRNNPLVIAEKIPKL